MPPPRHRTAPKSWIQRTFGSTKDAIMIVGVVLSGLGWGRSEVKRHDDNQVSNQQMLATLSLNEALSARVDTLELSVARLRRVVRSLGSRHHRIAESDAPLPLYGPPEPHGEFLSALRKLWPWGKHDANGS